MRHPPNFSTTFFDKFFQEYTQQAGRQDGRKGTFSQAAPPGEEGKAGKSRVSRERKAKNGKDKPTAQTPGKKRKSRLLQQTAHLYNNKGDLLSICLNHPIQVFVWPAWIFPQNPQHLIHHDTSLRDISQQAKGLFVKRLQNKPEKLKVGSYLMFGFRLFHSDIGGRTPMPITSSRNSHK